MTAFVSLFRGINVGGHQKIRMDELKDLLKTKESAPAPAPVKAKPGAKG